MKALIVIDVQNEYVTPGRPFNIEGIAPSLEQLKSVLGTAREKNWPVVHVRHLQAGSIFNPESNLSDFVEGVSPNLGEYSVQKSNFSCFSSPEFVNFVEKYSDHELVVVGYGSTMCCLSTIVDGYHKGFKFSFVQDASASKAIGGLTEAGLHTHAVAIISTFAEIKSAGDFV